MVYGSRAVYYDVRAELANLDEMLRYSKGVRKVPVIVEDDNVSIGYAGGS